MPSVDKYGYFDAEERCFVLENEPPRKWINLHCNEVGDDEIYAEISNIGDGPTRVRDKDGVQVQLVSYDSKYLYIRNQETGTVFSPWGAPAPQEVTERSCRYYAAKTEITGTCEGLKVIQRVFVPKIHPVEVWSVTVENLEDRPQTINLFAYAMFQLTGTDSEGRGVGKQNFAEVYPEINGVFAVNRNVECPTDRFKGYLIALSGFKGADAYRDQFFRSEFSCGTPRILWGYDCQNQPGFGPDCAGAVQVEITIPPKSRGRADFVLGQAASIDEVKDFKATLSPKQIDAWCDEQMETEKQRADMFRVEIGNPNYEGLINNFVKKQLYNYLINKSGFRDNLQVDCAVALFDCKTATDNLLRALASQYADGSVPHGFRPLNRLQYADKPAWIFLTVPALIKESGEMSLLDREVPYFESDESGTVWDHMLRAMRFLAVDLGRNGLCDQHHADWNDGLEATEEAGERESVFVTMQLCYGLREMVELARRRGDTEVEKEAEELYSSFSRKLNDVAWDGEWFVRTICGDGYRIGSHTNGEGKIFLNTQSWAVLSGVADSERAKQCMSKVDELIRHEVGYRICSPGFSSYDPRVGRMSNSEPGHVENGGCYNHAAGFKGVADCMLGRAEEAWETFVKVTPDSPENPVSNSECEPFSYNNYYSTVEVVYGKSGYPWRTGTAGWFTMLLIEWILGARRHYDGLLIDPCLSKTIPHARLTRTYRGAVYEIEIDNSAGRCTGVTSITLDGKEIEGNLLPVSGNGTHTVKVVI